MKTIIKQLSVILDKKQKTKIIILVFLMIIGGGLETLGVSMIIPFVAAITQPETLANFGIVNKLFGSISTGNNIAFIIIVLCCLVAIYIIKNIYLLVMYKIEYNYIYSNQYLLTNKLLTQCLNKPYEFFLNINVAQVNAVIASDVPATFSALTNCLLFATDAIMCLCLILFLLSTDFYMTVIIAGLLGITMILIKKFFKPISTKIGEETRSNYISITKCINQSVYGIKEVKVFNREREFVNKYQRYGKEYTRCLRDNALVAQIPRALIETICIIGIAGYLIGAVALGKDISNMIPQISAFGLAVIRLMPSANRISNYLNGMAYLSVSVQHVYDEVINTETPIDRNYIEDEKPNRKKEILAKSSIELKGINFSYTRAIDAIYEDANMRIPIGKAVGIIGESGAGKSTIVDIMLGLLLAQSGEILVDGNSIFDNYESWLSKIGYIPQMIYLLDDTIRANVAFGIEDEYLTEEKVWKALEEAQIASFVRELPNQLDTVIGDRGVRISGGQRQRIGIARALYHNPEILIFDEATSALDNETENAIIESIERLHGEKTIVIIAHRLATIKNCDIFYQVENQKINMVNRDDIFK